MRKVVSNSEVYHLWANQRQEEARNSGNTMSFESKLAYSYSACIGAIHPTDNSIVFLSYDSWSNTTSRHQNMLCQASNHKTAIYCLRPKLAYQGYHEDNLVDYIRRIGNYLENLDRKRNIEKYINHANFEYSRLKTYCDLFNLEIPKEADELLEVNNKDKYKDYLANLKEKRELAKLKEIEEYYEWLEENLPKWRNGELQRLYKRYDRDYLRIHNNRIQTTQGIDIPIELGKRLYSKIINKELKVDDDILNYRILEVNDEYFRVGCHVLYYDECKLIAKQLNL
jgi:hypothetical protein